MDSEEEDQDDDNESDDGDVVEEKAYTLAIIANADFDYNEVAEKWMIYAESM